MPNPDDLVMVEEIDRLSWQIREVYAKFGLAMYQGQALEHEIVNLLSWSGISTGEYTTHEQVETGRIDLFTKTMGALKTTLLRHRIDVAHLEDDLIRAVKLRNFLAHHYFRERTAAFMTGDGRERMIAELDHAVEFFGAVDSKLTPFTRLIMEEFVVIGHLEEAKENIMGRGFGQPLLGVA